MRNWAVEHNVTGFSELSLIHSSRVSTIKRLLKY